jgi:hypothetical protein
MGARRASHSRSERWHAPGNTCLPQRLVAMRPSRCLGVPWHFASVSCASRRIPSTRTSSCFSPSPAMWPGAPCRIATLLLSSTWRPGIARIPEPVYHALVATGAAGRCAHRQLYCRPGLLHQLPSLRAESGIGRRQRLLQEKRVSHSTEARILGVSRGTLTSLAKRHRRIEQIGPIESAHAESHFGCPNVSK